MEIHHNIKAKKRNTTDKICIKVSLEVTKKVREVWVKKTEIESANGSTEIKWIFRELGKEGPIERS